MLVSWLWRLPRVRPSGQQRLRNYLNWLAGIAAGFHVLFLLIAGIFEGFGKSPYSFSFFGIVTNLIYVSASLLGNEFARSFLVNHLAKKHATITIVCVGLLFTLLNLQLAQCTDLNKIIEFTRFFGTVFFPSLLENVLATYLAYAGGFLPALIYRGLLQAFQWFCPILPDLDWPSKTLLGSFIPLFSLFFISKIYMMESRQIRRSSLEKENPLGWIGTSVVSVLMVWFSVGLMPIFPSVILSGSMEPWIKKGDIVMVEKMNGAEAKLGDPIQYRYENIFINHRVIEIQEKDGKKLYRTKGDANKSADPDLVSPEQIKGKIVMVIPKLGWTTIVMKTFTGGISPQGEKFFDN
ncbi:signal peptidase I [Heliobacillus mobilis]|uniref:Signal peptidase I n=1 Tax=Heliobacterium mobile TaxID=28064 RepID=A0A6I3SM09_HELMO|nr:signal peptidase I [Heliobacterium mobile]